MRFVPAVLAGADRLVVEVRALRVPDGKYERCLSGFFDLARLDDLWRSLVPLLMAPPEFQPKGVYLTLNGVPPDFLARANHRFKDAKKHTLSVKDNNVLRRRRILIDIDPMRLSGMSATDAEKAAARAVVDVVRDDLDRRGWPSPLFVDSGNGFHLWYPVDLPADDGGLVKRFLLALAAQHDTAQAQIDPTVFNPSRIAKLPGTWARKGDSIPTRPHRLCRVIDTPEAGDTRLVTLEQLEAIAIATATVTTETRSITRASDRGPERVDASGDDRVARCRAYLRKLPPAVEGERGSDRTFEAARIIWNDFAIDELEGWPLLCEWNQRCRPPWTEEVGSQSLRRKWNEAVAKGADRRGSKLSNPKRTTAASVPQPNAPRTGVALILEFFRERYRPVFRRGNAIHTGDGRTVPVHEACSVPDSGLMDNLFSAVDAPQLRTGGTNRQALPAFFRSWARVAWGDLLVSLPDQDHAELASDAPAAEEFRRLVREALLTDVVLGDTIGLESGVTRTERRSLIDWCWRFAKLGPWRDIRSKRCWCRLVELPGSELKLRVALRHEVFAQVKADRRLSEMGSRTFARRAERYGVGTTSRDVRPHGFTAVMLTEAFVEELIATLPDDHSSQDTSVLGE
jgi:hypothetical protein